MKPATNFRYPESEAHGGRLFYRDSIPVLVTEGDPTAVGQQVRELALVPAARLLSYPLDFLRYQIRIPLLPRLVWFLLRRPSRKLYRNIPDAYRTEIESAAGKDKARLIAANTLFDMDHMGVRPLFGCSSVVASPQRSAAGRLLFGRNLDFYPLGYLHDYSLVTVYRPSSGRLGFASVGFPGIVGCFSGMNSAGLCVARHEVVAPKTRRTFSADGVPFAIALRGVMEACRTVEEAVERLTHTRHATLNIVLVADKDNARVAELTPDGVFVRDLGDSMGGCSNHFLHPATANPTQVNEFATLDRLATLQKFSKDSVSPVGVADVWNALGRVQQGELTVQSMVFEPGAGAIHVGFGSGPTTDRAPVRIDLAELLA
jgi:hypothetical protein